MRVIYFNEEYNRIWDEVFARFDFHPSPYPGVIPFELNQPHRVYALPEFVWDEAQEALVDQLLAAAVHEEIYALDYNHPAYAYVPGEPRPTTDSGEGFPSYYPNGDYYFFVAQDLSYGILGHPWQQKMYVFGSRLLHLFDGQEAMLGMTEISKETK